MWMPRDIIPFAAAATAAVSMGVGAGLFIALPDYFAERIAQAEPSTISAIDPNLAKYNQMMADQGINAIPPTLGTGWFPVSAAANEIVTSGVSDLESTFATEEADFQADAKARRSEDIDWYNAQRALVQDQTSLASRDLADTNSGAVALSGDPQRYPDRFQSTDEPIIVPSAERATTGSTVATY
jgi:hypothetical protein